MRRLGVELMPVYMSVLGCVLPVGDSYGHIHCGQQDGLGGEAGCARTLQQLGRRAFIFINGGKTNCFGCMDNRRSFITSKNQHICDPSCT